VRHRILAQFELLNKMGVTRLELRQNAMAHEMFLRTVRLHKKDAVAWNNLGVTEYVVKNYMAAVADYKRASKLDRKSAVYHSNLGMAYFGSRDIDGARRQFATAIELDPGIMLERDTGGTTAHIVGTENYSELCFEIAKLYAHEHRDAETRLWLAKAYENGYDVREGLRTDVLLQAYEKDPQILQMMNDTDHLKARRTGTIIPSLKETSMNLH
jgi:tetratricopeptide (TPR) repeat protein